jgi:hypothetical protein
MSKLAALLFISMLAVSSLIMVETAFAQASPVIIATPTPPPTPTPAPVAPTPTPTRNIALDYSEISRASEGNNTRLVLAVTATYNFGGPVTIVFQSFTLNIAVERGGPPPFIQPGDFWYTGTANPLETGTVTLDSNNSEESFQLTFVFSTLQPNTEGQTPFTNYQLVYSGSTTTASPSPTPTATSSPVPTPTSSQEPPQTEQIKPILNMAIVVAVIIVAVGASLLVYFRKRNHAKTNKHSETAQSST